MLKRYRKDLIIVGTDEAGRGCLAGPVTAAAVILPKNFANKLLNDSKLTSLKDRNTLKEVIEQKATSFAVAHVDMAEIDEINILNASILAMHRAIDQLHTTPQHIIVDGNRFKPFGNIPYECIIKGDEKYLSIAAASILAKTYRDAVMEEMHEEFPMYNWKKNKGYPTVEHRAAIKQFGTTKYHRQSFKLLPDQLKLEL
ncbi:ribonuclease HII [Salegentibacter chungangensis]|uniref:Ribonuclease HII n=1 Tax=Salegentibacter chungangensis TaxID=1335724 RepID=A0ABW3NP29_9FLAO